MTQVLFKATAENANKARTILEDKINEGRVSAMSLLSKIEDEVPTDAIAKGKALNFKANGGVAVALGDGELLDVGRHALTQMAQRAGVPGRYLTDLAATEGWQRELACNILTRHFHEGEPESRYLARSVGGRMRGFLSDRFRRLDNRPLVNAFAEECHSVGAVPIDGTYSETRVALKALLPEVYEPVPGEVLAFGVEWHNSDYGNGSHSLRAFALRVWCLNGCTMEDILSQIHLGRKLSDDLELSQKTYELDTATSISAMRDVVKGSLAPRKINQLCEAIKESHDKKIDWKAVKTKIGKRLTKGELEKAETAFEGQDVYNLPAGKSEYRASQAIAWIANEAEPDRKLELQRTAGLLTTGVSDKAA